VDLRACPWRLCDRHLTTYTTHNHNDTNSPFHYASGGFSLPLEKFYKQIHNVSPSFLLLVCFLSLAPT
jgi:hypothetical protein